MHITYMQTVGYFNYVKNSDLLKTHFNAESLT